MKLKLTSGTPKQVQREPTGSSTKGSTQEQQGTAQKAKLVIVSQTTPTDTP